MLSSSIASAPRDAARTVPRAAAIASGHGTAATDAKASVAPWSGAAAAMMR